jgi:transposase-like protein
MLRVDRIGFNRNFFGSQAGSPEVHVWLYFRFTLSFRDIEELLAARGIVVTYETIRQWCLKFGQPVANEVRRRLPRPGDKWHLDVSFRWACVTRFGVLQ